MKKFHLLFLLFLAMNCNVETTAQPTIIKEIIPVVELHKDFEILKKVLIDYHPGLYRFQDSLTVAGHFTALKEELNRDLSTAEFYLILSKFTTKLQCGHTFCSFYNQKKAIQEAIFNQSDKVPFTFSLFEKQMIIAKNLSELSLPNGSQVLAINDIPVAAIIDSLILYTKGDGSNDGKRLNDLQLTGLGKFETFDIYFPLLFPPINSTYELELKKLGTEEIEKVTVKCIRRKERFDLIEQKYGDQASTYDELWSFKILNENTAYLMLGTFVTYKMSLDWKAFLKDAFKEIEAKNISNLIIEIRDNEGGDDEVSLTLTKYLASRQITTPAIKELLTYDKVSDEMKPYLKTWDKDFYDRTKKVIQLKNGLYTWKKGQSEIPKIIKQQKSAFAGNVVLLVNEANSSATFFLAQTIQENKIATLIGTETGGNRKGTNGSNLFFLRLPNSKIEIDIPLVGRYPIDEQPDRGLTPDIVISKTLEDVINKRDVTLEKALEFLKKK